MQRTDAASPEREPGGDSPLFCPGCGKALEPPLAGSSIPAPPRQSPGGPDDRWSEGPPEVSANRWSAQPPLGDDSSSSESVSQTSILPRGELEQPVHVRRPVSPLVWALIVLVVFLAALIGVTVVARSMRPWLAARRAAAEQSTVEFWLPRLDKGGEARQKAAQAIVELGPAAVCRALDHIATDPGGGKQFQFDAGAIRALAEVGAEAVPGLREGLAAPEPKVRAAAVEVLLQMGAAGRGARDSLLATLDDSNPGTRYAAIDTLGYLGADGAPAVKRLAEFVASPLPHERDLAIKALGRIGPEARDAVPALERAAAEEPDLLIRASASRALKQIDVVRRARAARREANGEMRQWLKALGDDDVPAAIAAAEAVGGLGLKGEPAAPALALMLRHADRSRRLAAAAALGRLGLAAIDFKFTLEAAAHEEDAEVRAAAAKALELIGGKP
jgi:HEAT repeat protein